jgi:histidinol dehydrogenase
LAGGAQAIAAMAYGTETITRVDKIFGPGNQFVTKAKTIIQSTTTTAIDMPAGPSEVLVIADETAKPEFTLLPICWRRPSMALIVRLYWFVHQQSIAQATLAEVENNCRIATRRNC